MTGRLTMADIIGADRCPFCGIGTVKVFDEVHTWVCRFCHKTGDLFTWVMQRDQIDFKEAVMRLLTRFGHETTMSEQTPPPTFPILTDQTPLPGPFRISGPQATIMSAVVRERRHQDQTHGTIVDHPHSVGEWLLIIETELLEAKAAWVRETGDRGALLEILQVVSTGFACLEQHGVVERDPWVIPPSVNDAIDRMFLDPLRDRPTGPETT